MNIMLFAALSGLFLWALLRVQVVLAYFGVVTVVAYCLWLFQKRKAENSPEQRIWSLMNPEPTQPRFYSYVDIDVTKSDLAMEAYNSKNPEARLTLSSFGLCAIGRAMKELGLGDELIFGNSVKGENPSLSLIVDINGKDVANVPVSGCGTRNIVDVAKHVNKRVKTMKTEQNKSYNIQKRIIGIFPSFLATYLMWLGIFFVAELKLSYFMPLFRVSRIPVGALSNLSVSFISRVASSFPCFLTMNFIATMGTPKPTPVAVEGKVGIRRIMTIGFLFDDRMVSFEQSCRFVKILQPLWDKMAEEFI